MSALSRNVWDTVSNPGVVFSAGGVTNNLTGVTFSNSNGVSFGLNAGVMTASAVGGGGGSLNISAGTTSSNVSAVTFSNANGVSWGFDGTSISATVKTNYAGTGFTSATTAGTAIVGTLNTNGVSLGVPAFLTTAALSNQTMVLSNSQAGYSNGTIGISEGGGAITIATSAGGQSFMFSVPQTSSIVGVNGISISTNGSTISVSNIGPAISAGTVTSNASAFTFSNSNGVAFGLGTGASAGIITASYTVPTVTNSSWTVSDTATSVTVGRLAFTAANGITMTLSTSNNGNHTVFASYTVPSVTNSSWTVSDSATSATVGRLAFVNTNGVSFALTTSNNGQQSIGASIATTYAGTGFTSTSTAGVNIVATLNTSGLSMGVPAFLTTAAVSSTPLSYWANLFILENTTTTMCQSNSFYVFPVTLDNNLSISYARLLASIAFTSTSIATSAVNNATGASTAFSETMAFNAVLYTVGTGGSSLSLRSFFSTSVGLTWAVSVSQASTSNASNQSITQVITYPSLGFSTATASTQYSVSTSNGPISTTQWSNLSAQRFLDIPFATSLTGGNYWFAINRISGTVGGQNMDVNASTYGVSQQNLSFGNINAATNASNCAPQQGLGLWTTNAAQTTGSIAFASVSATSSYIVPFVQFIRQA